MVVVALALMKDKPEDVGQVPDGALPVDAAADASAQRAEVARAVSSVSKVYKTARPKTSKEAMRSLPFWLIWLGSFSVFVALNLAVSSGVLYFSALGLDVGVIAGAVAVQGVAAVAVNLERAAHETDPFSTTERNSAMDSIRTACPPRLRARHRSDAAKTMRPW